MNYQILARRLFFKNNSAYGWEKILGHYCFLHSYDGVSRSWNIANNPVFKSIQDDKLPNEIETLSEADRYNDML
jgi:oxygen-independent coproporphyrinogen-3 oxidase